ncbi:hypothetical protein GPJ56_008904 [Histomonas meleagridis]|uniref:uncharacterized protein n=1 Tax=Histomonas meleagridis TaxID=135588 RepID=UPI00355A3517|nr:hypothetical protein GPJ56_008904 [Histomonas meleagridis]KAH0797830.1 hypothetical protein GO595_009459 [Histomonas meleagridis]
MSVVSAGAPGGSRLGREGDPSIPLPIDIETNGIICIGVGWKHNIVVYEDGHAIGWGSNEDDQLGISCRETLTPKPLRVFENYHLTWVHCGDKITVVLTEPGDAYVIGSTYGRTPVHLNIPTAVIYCTCGVGTVYVIDVNGDIYSCSSSTGNCILYHLPEPVCDIAAGSAFCIALTISGKAYARGRDAACGCSNARTTDGFIPITSLSGITISRVFSYCSHSIVLTRDGRIFVCGSNNDGRIGLNTQQQQTSFQQLHFFDGMNVNEIDCGDAHSVFITESGEIYGCGASDDGRTFAGKQKSFPTPTKSNINGKAVFVRCGCFHTVVLLNVRRPIHPGLLYFGMLIGNIRKPKLIKITSSLIIDVAIGSISSMGFLPGDVVFNGNDVGVVVGIKGDKICLRINENLALYKKNSLTFMSRNNCVKKEEMANSGTKMILDANPKICLAFGIHPDDVVFHSKLLRGTVGGYANGTVWFKFDSLNGRICRCKGNSLQEIHSAIKIIESKRTINYVKCDDEVEYPIEPLDHFNICTDQIFGIVIGQIGNMYCVSDLFSGNYSLIPKKKTHKIQEFNLFKQFDVVQTPNGCGAIIACNDQNVLMLTDENLLNNHPPTIEHDLKLIYRAFGDGYVEYNGQQIFVGISRFDPSGPIPGDIYSTKIGFVRILGSLNEKIMCCTNLEISNFDVELIEFESLTSECFVRVSRRMLQCKQKYSLATGGSVEVSIDIGSFARMKFCACDEFELCGVKYIVFGCKDEYLWVLKENCKGLMFIEGECDAFPMCEAKLVSRPTKHYEKFFK